MKYTVFDAEVCPNKAMIGFKDLETGKISQFQHDEGDSIAEYIKDRILIGFNSRNYDNIIVTAIMRGKTPKQIYNISFSLIEGEGNRWDYPNMIENDIDLIEVAPGQYSLKAYGAILNAKKLQDLPYSPHEKHSKKMWKNVCKYNKNDLDLTELVYNELKPRLDIREQLGNQYNINVMSRSDAQAAEDIFQVELDKVGIDARKEGRKKKRIKTIKYVAPEAVKFKSDELNKLVKRIEDTTIEINGAGSPTIPKWLKDEKITIGKGVYNIGLGGLHSTEKSTMVIPPKGMKLGNVDVASMYPSLIIELGLYPTHLSEAFLSIYRGIRDRRMEAKHNGNKTVSNTLKIVLNGSYGKFGSAYSFLYAPDLMLQVTLTGQLYLLMLIEAFENNGIEVVSSNTDGIELIYDDIHPVKKLVNKWEKRTKLEMEYGEYKALYSRDVNAYVAVYEDEVKSKGFYDTPGFKVSGCKGWEYPIVTEAIREFLSNGTPMEKTIMKCKDPSQFCVARTVNGGAIWSPEDYPNTEEYEEYLKKVPFKQNKALEKRNDNFKKEFVLAEASKYYIGKVVRYYYAKDGKPMFYKGSGNRVPKSDGCKPMMKLVKKMPKDIDFDKYIELADTHLKELGYE